MMQLDVLRDLNVVRPRCAACFKLMCDVLASDCGELLAQMGHVALLERVQPPEVVVIKLLSVHYHCMVEAGWGCFLH